MATLPDLSELSLRAAPTAVKSNQRAVDKADVPRNRTRVRPARAAKLVRRKWHLLHDVPDELLEKITQTMALNGGSLEEVCKTIRIWCNTARAVGCKDNDGMFRSLLVVFGLPPEWLSQTRPTATGGEEPVVPQTPDPFPSWWILWLTLCKAFDQTPNWGELDPRLLRYRRPMYQNGPPDDLVIRDVLLDPTSGIRVRAEVHNLLAARVRGFPVPAGGIYHLPDASPPHGTTNRSALARYGQRMTAVALHWLTKPGWNKGEALVLGTNRDNPGRVHLGYQLWPAADQALADLLQHAGWLEGRGTITQALSTISPSIRRVVPRDMDYDSQPELLADYLLNTLGATLAYTAGAAQFDGMLRVLDELPTDWGIPVAELEQTQLMHVYDAVVDSEIRNRIQRTLWTRNNMRWMSVLQRIKYSVEFSVPESHSGAGDAVGYNFVNQPRTVRSLDDELKREIRRMVEEAASKPDYRASYSTYDQTGEFMNNMARKYGGDQKTLAHKFNAAWSELDNNRARLQLEVERQGRERMLLLFDTDDKTRKRIKQVVKSNMFGNPRLVAEYAVSRDRRYRHSSQKLQLEIQRSLNVPKQLWSGELDKIVRQIVDEEHIRLLEAMERREDPDYRPSRRL